MGHEPPEVAQQFLTQGWYRPRPSQDVWACGLTLANMMGAKPPQQHLRLLNHPGFPAERASGRRDISKLPVHKAYYEYLKALSDGGIAYEQQVCLFLMLSLHPLQAKTHPQPLACMGLSQCYATLLGSAHVKL